MEAEYYPQICKFLKSLKERVEPLSLGYEIEKQIIPLYPNNFIKCDIERTAIDKIINFLIDEKIIREKLKLNQNELTKYELSLDIEKNPELYGASNYNIFVHKDFFKNYRKICNKLNCHLYGSTEIKLETGQKLDICLSDEYGLYKLNDRDNNYQISGKRKKYLDSLINNKSMSGIALWDLIHSLGEKGSPKTKHDKEKIISKEISNINKNFQKKVLNLTNPQLDEIKDNKNARTKYELIKSNNGYRINSEYYNIKSMD